MTIQDVARHLRISWDAIKEIQKRDLTGRFSRPCLKNVRRIAIDEISVRKGHRYLTVVPDMDTGAVIFVGDGKGILQTQNHGPSHNKVRISRMNLFFSLTRLPLKKFRLTRMQK